MLTCEKVANVPKWDDAITFGSLGEGLLSPLRRQWRKRGAHRCWSHTMD